MTTLPAIGFALSALVGAPALAVLARASRDFDRRLKSTHPHVWARIAPDPRLAPSLSSASARFIMRGDDREVPDPLLTALGDRCHRAGYWAMSAFLGAVLSTAVPAILGG
ncbi:hypothetical protein [Marilutibacter aestuarii]|uniref:Uncharacterized protein n=1 Tax=Marilutibacter aestuarii TaxID=1706195 RepID=A0A508A7W2_9GAMM|nr:hypothetical protein [Lysobacter aestuarii]TQD44903.1 hypothetical protein FKV25_09345 [Lysobacter aestuarii]